MGLNSVWVKLLFAVLIIGYGLFLNIQTIQKLRLNRKTKKEYLANKKDGEVETIQDYAAWAIAYMFAGVIGIFGIIQELNGKRELLMIATYIFVFLYIFAFLFQVLIRRSIMFDDSGFFYDSKYYRFRSINGFDLTKGFFKTYEIRLTTQSEKVLVPKKYGMLIEERAAKKKKIKLK